MADLEQLKRALVNADRAGDTQAARVFAGEIRKMQSAPQPPQVGPEATTTVDPTEGMSTGQKFLAGVGKAFVDLGRGTGQLARDYALPTEWADYAGLPTQEDIDRAKERDAPLMRTGAGVAGNIFGNIAATAPTMAIPGVGAAKGASALGAALGAIQPTATGESRALNTAVGGAAGLVGNLAPKLAARLINPKAVANVRALQQAGITDVTPGQAVGGTLKTLEEKATSLPIAGSIIQRAQQGGVESFNKAAINQVLKPIGAQVDDIGHEGIRKAGEILSKQYDDLLPKLKVQADPQFMDEVIELRRLASSMPKQTSGQLDRILRSNFLTRFTQHGLMSGEQMKAVDSELGRLARSYRGSATADQRQLGDALAEAQSILRGLVERSNPDHAGKLKAINEAYANFVRVQKAAGMQGAKDGIFTPNQLLNAVRATDTSVRKGAFARGQAKMQDFAELANRSISSKYPDSGTAGRLLTAAAGGAYVMNPPAAIGEGALAGLYGTRLGQRMLLAALAERPEKAALLAKHLRALAPATGRIAAIGSAAYPKE